MFATIDEAEHIIGIKTRLYKSDFIELIPPKKLPYRSIAQNKDIYPPSPISSSAEIAMGRLLQSIIEGNNRLGYYWSSLYSRYDYNVFDLFRTIDKYRSGYVTNIDLALFLKNAAYIGASDVPEFFIMALDRNKDGKLWLKGE